MKFKNGQVRVLQLILLSISLRPNKNGMFTITTEPTEDNPNGVWQRTMKQLQVLADNVGVATVSALGRLGANGDCKLNITEEFCAEGEASPDDPTVIYTKDWWKVSNMDIEVGPVSRDFVDRVVAQVAVADMQKNLGEAATKAQNLRMQLRSGIAQHISEEPDEDLVEEESEELAEETPTIKAKAKRK